MKVLLDTCVWGGARDTLRAAGHEVEWAGEWLRDPGDDEILRNAAGHGQVLVTLDKDFGELAIVHGLPHHGIVRLVNLRAEAQGHVCAAVLVRYGHELARGAIVTADAQRMRIRPPEADIDESG